jgi:hypothetical protein
VLILELVSIDKAEDTSFTAVILELVSEDNSLIE